MKTDQPMVVTLKEGVLHINHKSMMGNLAGLFDMGNVYRFKAGKPTVTMPRYLALESTKDYLATVEEEIGRPALVTKEGKSGGTQAHLYVLIDAAMYLSPSLKLELIKEFVQNRLLQWRDVAGEEFKQLNSQILICAEEVFGKPAHTGHYTNIAKIIRNRILPEEHLGWNFANSLQLTERARIENQIVAFLKMGVVRDWEHLKEIAGKV